MSDSCKSSALPLETFLDLRYTPKQNRNEMVDLAAQSITIALGDSKSHGFYCHLIWNLLRRYDQQQDYFVQVYELILRARTDYQEGFARSAGGLLVSRLKKWEVWDWLERTPPVRVGALPIIEG